MRFAIAAAVTGLAATAMAGSNDTYVTEVVTAYTTYCPEATMITHNSVTYTVTEPTTLTITNCPCTVTKPVYSTVSTSCSTSSAYTPAPVYPSKNATAPAYMPSGTGAYSTGAYSTKPVSTSTSTSPVTPPAYTGAANKASFGVAGLLAAAGLIAAL